MAGLLESNLQRGFSSYPADVNVSTQEGENKDARQMLTPLVSLSKLFSLSFGS